MVIEKDIPIPTKNGYKPRTEATRTFMEMDPKDSVKVLRIADLMSMQAAAKRTGRKMTYRKTDGGWRVWRVE